MSEEMVRVYQQADSAPITWWSEAQSDQTEAWSGFGRCEIVEVPRALWVAYEDARSALGDAEYDLEQYGRRRRVPLP